MEIRNYLISLLLTETIEVGVALWLGYRRSLEIAAVMLASLVTHPVFHYLWYLNAQYAVVPDTRWNIPCAEVVIVLVEWGLLVYALKGRRKCELLVLSVTMNGCSYLTGLLLYRAGILG